MNKQKRHLTLMSFIVALTLAALCYGGQMGGWQRFAADSHNDNGEYLCSHENRSDTGARLPARGKVVVKGQATGGSQKTIGGQIG